MNKKELVDAMAVKTDSSGAAAVNPPRVSWRLFGLS